MAVTITQDQVRTSPRGRKANVDPALVKLLTEKALPEGKLVILGEDEGIVPTSGPGPERSRNNNRIRRHWTEAGREGSPSIRYRPMDVEHGGLPQVSVPKPKKATK